MPAWLLYPPEGIPEDFFIQHGQIIITELTKAIIAQVDIPLEISKLEGDAIFLYALKTNDASWQDTSRQIGQKLLAFLSFVAPFLATVFYKTGTGILVPDAHALREGDVVEIELERIGTLRNPVTRLA